jgi:hypothetical protein
MIIGMLLALCAPTAPANAAELRPEWGKVTGKNAVLKAGCRNYRYRYEITAPDDGYWDLNVTLVDPRGKKVWFGYLYDGANPDKGRATFRLCRSQSVPGTYKLKSVVSVQDFADAETKGRLKTTAFRLRPAR